jgi:UDP-N-acetylmuramyl pentapeptide phosphotransferase/UDP-N-acetylglucosamine-1-phosphate transferase
LPPVVAFCIAFALLRVLLLPAFARHTLDQPNARSLHERAVPRSGGVAVTLGGVTGILIAGGSGPVVMLALALMFLSVLDDLKGLSPALRLVAHLGSAATFVLLVSDNIDSWWVVLVLVLAITWMINLYNFMDGADGLAGGMAVIGFTVYGWLAWSAGDTVMAASCAAVAAAALAFLFFNFPPARIFLGDSGSVPLGFMAAAMGAVGWQKALWPAWLPLIAFAFFIIDASVTLLRRLLHGEKVWRAHRDHYYQRLVLMGWTHRRLAGHAYGLMLISAVLGIAAVRSAPDMRIAILVGLGLIHGLVAVAVDSRWQLHAKA